MTAASTNEKKAASTAKTVRKSAAKSIEQTVEKTVEEAAATAADTLAAAGVELPETIRAISEQTLANVKDAYARAKANAEDATDVLEETFESARAGVFELQGKGVDMAKDSADAVFAHTKQLLSVDSFADAVQLQTTFAKDRYEAALSYGKTWQEISTKVFEDAAKPARTALAKATSV